MSLEGRDFYEVLEVPRSASSDDLRRAYRRKAVQYHPDKNKSPTATNDFQYLAKAYRVLTDARRRKLYDRTGRTDDMSDEFVDAYEAWRSVFPRVRKQDVESFLAKYSGSAMEREDLEAYFKQFKGDMSKLLEWIPGLRVADLPRVTKVFERMFAQNKLEETEVFRSSMAELQEQGDVEDDFADEAEEAEELLKEVQRQNQFDIDGDADMGSEDQLAALIRSKKKQRDNLFESMISKYEAMEEDEDEEANQSRGQKRKNRKESPEPDLPDDDEFERIQREIMARAEKRRGEREQGPTKKPRRKGRKGKRA